MDGKSAQSSPVQQLYVAVGSPEVKLTTLVDLLLALQANGPFGCAVICSSRDALDSLVSWLTPIQHTAVRCLHSDLSDDARTSVLQKYAKDLDHALRYQPQEREGSQAEDFELKKQTRDASDGAEDSNDNAASSVGRPSTAERALAHVLVSTDAGLRVAESTGLPASLALIVHFDLPQRKEVYLKRMGLFARRSPLKFTVFFVTAGEVAAFRTVEGFSAGSIDVMPVHISDIFPSHR